MDIKNTIRLLLNFLHLDLTQNLKYDRLTKLIMKKVIKNSSNCIDVGCHKGEILDDILKYAPNGKHFGFEPIPPMFNKLVENYKNKATILPYALSDKNGESTFQFVKNAPAYSGIIKRKYEVENAEIDEIKVELKKLDEVIPTDLSIDFIKIDVEGGEFDVLKGAIDLLKRNKPFVVFEFGLGASDFYGTKPEEIFNLLNKEIGLKISNLDSFIKDKPALEIEEFKTLYNTNKEYYFIAHK
jgi:FkbM family methyltransferase